MKTIVFLGDSITDASRLDSENGLGFGYVNQIGATLDPNLWGLINRGVDGFITERILNHLPADCISYKPDYVCILAGINDISVIMNTVSTEKDRTFLLEDCLRAYHQLLFDLTHETKAKILTLEPFLFPHPREYVNWLPWQQKLSKQIRKLSRNYGARFIPLHAELNQKCEVLGNDAITVDGIHLTHVGHKILADSVIAAWNL